MYSGRPSWVSRSAIELRDRARVVPRRSARKFQCSGRLVHSSGPRRTACSNTSAIGGTSSLRAASSSGLARKRVSSSFSNCRSKSSTSYLFLLVVWVRWFMKLPIAMRGVITISSSARSRPVIA